MHTARHGRKGGPETSKKGLSIGVVCPYACCREAMVAALGAIDGFRVVDCGNGAGESVSRVRDLAVPIVLLALEPGPSASIAAALRTVDPDIRVIAIPMSETESSLVRLAAAGVVEFVPPGAGLRECVRYIRAVGVRGFRCSPAIEALLNRNPANGNAGVTRSSAPAFAGLRGRQLEVAEFVGQGLSNKEIAGRLGIAVGTVKNHVHAMLAALGAEHRWQVGAMMRDSGIRPDVLRKSGDPK